MTVETGKTMFTGSELHNWTWVPTCPLNTWGTLEGDIDRIELFIPALLDHLFSSQTILVLPNDGGHVAAKFCYDQDIDGQKLNAHRESSGLYDVPQNSSLGILTTTSQC